MAHISKNIGFRTLFWAGFWIFLLDQATKFVVVQMLGLRHVQRIEVLPPFLEFRMAWNEGVNFGLFSGMDMRWVLIAVAFAICGFVLWWLRREGGSKIVYISAGILIGGALGNIVDRILYGAVADFLNMSCCGFENPYAFNVADIAIFVGALGLVFFTEDPKKKARKNK